MIEREITVTNRLGLHARASAKLVQRLAGFKASVHLTHRGREINAKSIMGLMMLAAGKGSVLKAKIDGPDEEEAWAAMHDLFDRKFDEGE
jgi:phosphocarrier protein HPr